MISVSFKMPINKFGVPLSRKRKFSDLNDGVHLKLLNLRKDVEKEEKEIKTNLTRLQYELETLKKVDTPINLQDFGKKVQELSDSLKKCTNHNDRHHGKIEYQIE